MTWKLILYHPRDAITNFEIISKLIKQNEFTSAFTSKYYRLKILEYTWKTTSTVFQQRVVISVKNSNYSMVSHTPTNMDHFWFTQNSMVMLIMVSLTSRRKSAINVRKEIYRQVGRWEDR